MWPLVVALGLILALGTVSGGNFGTPPANAEINTAISPDDEEVPAVWWFFPDDFDDSVDPEDFCDDEDQLVALLGEEENEIDDQDRIFLFNEPNGGESDRVWICVGVDSDEEPLEFDANDYGTWEDTVCIWDDDVCSDTNGLGTDTLLIHCDLEPLCDDNDDADFGDVAALFVCEDDKSGEADITITQGEADDPDGFETVTFRIICFNEVDEIDGEITCVPCTVEIVPALGNTQYALIYVKLLDEDGDAAAPGREVTFTTDNCEVAESTDDFLWEDVLLDPDADEDLDTFDEIIDIFEEFEDAMTPENADDIADFVDDFFDPEWDDEVEEETFLEEPFDLDDPFEDMDTFAATILNCGQGHDSEPGTAEVCAIVEVENDPDVVECVEVAVIGGPSTLTVTADPTSVRCGERSQITVTVKDAKGEPVSDHTLVEAVTNFGGVLGGTGAVAGQQGLVTPVSSTLAETINGVATLWLLTSESHSGPYEVIVTTGGGGAVAGTIGFDEDEDEGDEDFDDPDEDDEVFDFDEDPNETQTLGGLFSTGVINARVQVSCTIPAAAAPAPAPTVRAPSTGQGIIPPNTGDAGLADSSSSWTLFVIGGAVAFALAGVAGLKFARR
jgi:hypothetical protein